MIEPLESRVFLAGNPGVGFYNRDGTAATLDPQRNTWLLINGLLSSKDDEDFKQVARAISIQSPGDQVLIVDWEKLAAVISGVQGYKNAVTAGHWVAKQLKYAGIPGSHVNLLGFSMGGTVEDTIAKDLKKVNRIIAVDPAGYGSAFAKHSNYSISFRGTMSSGPALSAHDSVLLTNLPSIGLFAHVETFSVFLTMQQRDAGISENPGENISSIFSISNILNGQMPAWKKKSFKGFNAKLRVKPNGFGFDYVPEDLTYISQAGLQVDVT